MRVCEQTISIPLPSSKHNLLSHLDGAVRFRTGDDKIANRFTVTRSTAEGFDCEIGVLDGDLRNTLALPENIFRFAQRTHENTDQFNAVLIVPTGVGAEIGGHAGDATPVAKLLAKGCDTLITHPNVVNASDINEIPENALYVEGSVLSRLLMGTIGLQKVRSNRVLVVVSAHKNESFVNAAINTVNAARAAYGLECPKIVVLDPPFDMKAAFTESGRAAGEVTELGPLLEMLLEQREIFDAVALSSIIQVPFRYHLDYFEAEGEMVNPWGGVEALLTHAVSSILDVPSAHAPMFESSQVANLEAGVVDPRMAAEAISLSFLQCVLKGLQKSPKIIADAASMLAPGILSARDLSCLIIPDGCIGLPTLAALEQGIPVIAVRDNKNLMDNDLTRLHWQEGQLHFAENYLEAAGIMMAMRAGVSIESIRRPLGLAKVEIVQTSTHNRDDKSEIKTG